MRLRRRLGHAAAWCLVGALVVLGARTIAYALAPLPTPLSIELQRSVGGPRLVFVAGVAIGLVAVLSLGVLGLAVLAVRERLALERGIVVEPPRLRPFVLLGRFAALWAATSVAFAYFESYLHWRAGLGWHGLHCLVGPVHRDAVPLLAALSLLATALIGAVEHLLAWLRRTLAHLLARLGSRRARPALAPLFASPSLRSWPGASLPPRGPPCAAVLRRRAQLAAATT
jgi:hypothetical protein